MTRIADGSVNGKRMHAAGLRAINAYVKLQQSAARVVDGFDAEESTNPGEASGTAKPRAQTGG
jgi:hypothetical protein